MSERTIATNGVELHVVEEGTGFPVVFAHGFPELAYSWRHQLPAVAAAGYRAIAPDQRGYGRSSRPTEIERYDILHLTDDLIGVLDALGEERAVFVGHDWGSMVVWSLALRAPERVAGVSVPFLPRPPVAPTALMARGWRRRGAGASWRRDRRQGDRAVAVHRRRPRPRPHDEPARGHGRLAR
jgi:pimeloyl-ACP methyl ester carboxylesterase